MVADVEEVDAGNVYRMVSNDDPVLANVVVGESGTALDAGGRLVLET